MGAGEQISSDLIKICSNFRIRYSTSITTCCKTRHVLTDQQELAELNWKQVIKETNVFGEAVKNSAWRGR